MDPDIHRELAQRDGVHPDVYGHQGVRKLADGAREQIRQEERERMTEVKLDGSQRTRAEQLIEICAHDPEVLETVCHEYVWLCDYHDEREIRDGAHREEES